MPFHLSVLPSQWCQNPRKRICVQNAASGSQRGVLSPAYMRRSHGNMHLLGRALLTQGNHVQAEVVNFTASFLGIRNAASTTSDSTLSMLCAKSVQKVASSAEMADEIPKHKNLWACAVEQKPSQESKNKIGQFSRATSSISASTSTSYCIRYRSTSSHI